MLMREGTQKLRLPPKALAERRWAACVEFDGLVEKDSFPTGSLLLVRLRPFFGKNSWLTQYLYTCPQDLEERGVSIHAVRLPEAWVLGWDGVGVGRQGGEVRHLLGADFRALITRPKLVLLGHDEGRLLPQAEPEEFKTPPRPQLTQDLEVESPRPEEDLVQVPPSDEELILHVRGGNAQDSTFC